MVVILTTILWFQQHQQGTCNDKQPSSRENGWRVRALNSPSSRSQSLAGAKKKSVIPRIDLDDILNSDRPEQATDAAVAASTTESTSATYDVPNPSNVKNDKGIGQMFHRPKMRRYTKIGVRKGVHGTTTTTAAPTTFVKKIYADEPRHPSRKKYVRLVPSNKGENSSPNSSFHAVIVRSVRVWRKIRSSNVGVGRPPETFPAGRKDVQEEESTTSNVSVSSSVTSTSMPIASY